MPKYKEEITNEISGNSLEIKMELKKKLFQILPEINSDGNIDFEKFKDLFSDEISESNELYNFTWFGKGKAAKIAQKPTTATLLPNRDKSLDFDNTNNIYIEGDNLEVLKILLKSYSNRIKMIYIDPPYNTGKDFVYTDNYKDNLDNYLEMINAKDDEGNRFSSNSNTSGRYHTNWLNMMYPRLKLARNLLSDDGVIFISIDDNEQANLKEICDEIFGEDNFVASFPRVTKKGGKSSDVTAKNHDYILIYTKRILFADLIGVLHNDSEYNKKDEYFDIRGYYKVNQTLDYDSLGYVKTLDYPIEINSELFYAGGDFDMYKERQAGQHGRADWGWRWRWSKKLFDFGLENGFIEVHRGGIRPRLYTKTYQKVKIQQVGKEYEIVTFDRTKPLSTLEFTENRYSNDNAKKVFDNLMEKGMFEYTKPPELINQLGKIVNDNNYIVLDFFSGSATTADAVMQLNAEDDGNRRYIMVQLPELTKENSEAFKAGYRTIPEIAQERIRKAGKKILAEKPELKDKLDIGFKVFELEKSNFVKWNSEDNKEQLNLFDNNILKGRTDEDILYEILLKQGLQLTNKIIVHDKNDYKVFNIDCGKLFVVIGSNIIRDSADLIVSKRKEYKIEVSTVIFVDNGFKDDNEKLNAIEILKNNGYQDEQILSV